MDPSLLIKGALSGGAFAFFAYRARRYTAVLLALMLAVAALVYVYFALRSGADAAWMAIELTGLGIYGAFAWQGLRRSPWWLAAGWLLHPVWDVAVHYLGPGRAMAPESYTVPCLSFDLVVAAVMAFTIVLRGKQAFVPAPASRREVGLP
jgi:hypothetical protein